MAHRIHSTLSLFLALALVAGCAATEPPAPVAPMPSVALIAPMSDAMGTDLALVRCDDGGDGGVLIDGICL